MEVPLLNLKAQHDALQPALDEACQRVIRSGQYVLGPEVEALESEIESDLQVNHAIAVSSGTDALLMALMAHGIGPGDEVLVPAFTFFASAGCVARVGARPVFVDVCPVCFNIDLAHAETLVTPQTRAIIPVHLFGQGAEMDDTLALARQHNLIVIEDNAQAVGGRYRGRMLGSMGHCATLSFYPTKNLSALGDAGMLLTQDGELADRFRQLRNHGMHPRYIHHQIGGNFRMDAFQGAILREKRKHLSVWNHRRGEVAAAYTRGLSQFARVIVADEATCSCPRDVLGGQHNEQEERLVLPVAYSHNDPVWHQYTLRVRLGERDALQTYLKERGIQTGVFYPLSLDQQPCFQYLLEGKLNSIATAHCLARQVLQLPIYPELTQEQIDYVIATIGQWLAA